MWKFVVKYFVTKMRCDEMWWDVVIKIVIRCCESFVIKCFIICFIVCCEIFCDEMWWDVAKWDVVKELSLIYCESLWRDVVKVLWWNICRSIYHNALWYMMQLTISFLKNNSLNVWWRFMMKLCDEMFVAKYFVIRCCESFVAKVLW